MRTERENNSAFQSLAILQQLTLEAGLSESREQLQFRMLNRSQRYCSYDRAVLWQRHGRRWKLVGVSGACAVNRRGPLAAEWKRLVQALSQPEQVSIIDPQNGEFAGEDWRQLAQRTDGVSVLWAPIVVGQRCVAALWLERWGGQRFTPADGDRVAALALSYGVAWRAVGQCRRGVPAAERVRRGVLIAVVAAVLLAALVWVQVPLRVVAPCEVVPRDPVAITAPLNGVIEEVPVLPGRRIAEGTLLATYDQRIAREELKVARQQVQIIESDLERARVQAFDNDDARAQIALLENRLQQERVRLRLAQLRVDQLEVRAPVPGTLMLDDPHEWAGRPVQVGERLMLIVDPAQTKLRIWLPEDDNVAFDPHRPVRVILASDPRQSRSARLRFVSSHSETTADGHAAFRAEAEWTAAQPDLRMGLQGTAVLHGEDVSLGYWLLRRPLAALRRFVGV